MMRMFANIHKDITSLGWECGGMSVFARGLFTAIIGLGCLSAASAQAEKLVVTTEDYPPFNMTKPGGGEVVGISTDILKKAFALAKVDYQISLYPWARAYSMAQTDAKTCVYSTTRTEAREALFKWIGPLANNDWVLFASAESTAKPASLDDVKTATIGGYQGDALSDFLKEKGFKVEVAPSDALNPKKLAAGRIDFWAAGKLLGPYIAAQAGVTGLRQVLAIKETSMYLACSKDVADETVAGLNAAIKKLQDDGSVAAVNKLYQ
jgi:polar amino acid transport system substrate-binding protein